MSHSHVVVVDHYCKHVGRGAVGAQQHEVVEMLILPYDASLHLVLNHRLAGQRRFEPDHWFDPCRSLGGAAIAPATVIQSGAPLTARLFPHLRQLLR